VITETLRDQVSADVNGMLMRAPNMRKDLRLKTIKQRTMSPVGTGNP
jgi:hypothetical protein